MLRWTSFSSIRPNISPLPKKSKRKSILGKWRMIWSVCFSAWDDLSCELLAGHFRTRSESVDTRGDGGIQNRKPLSGDQRSRSRGVWHLYRTDRKSRESTAPGGFRNDQGHPTQTDRSDSLRNNYEMEREWNRRGTVRCALREYAKSQTILESDEGIVRSDRTVYGWWQAKPTSARSTDGCLR